MAELGTGLPEELREQQRAMGAVLRAAASGRGLQPVLDEVAAASMRLCRADTSSLYVLDGALLHAVARAGVVARSSRRGTPTVAPWPRPAAISAMARV